MAEQMPKPLRRRMLMFYFAAGMNVVMALWVLSAGAGRVSGGLLGVIVLVFLAFGWLNYYLAKMLQKQWEAHLRQRMAGGGER